MSDVDLRAGEYVLGLADPGEVQRIESQIARDPVLARAVADWRERLSALDATAAPLEPSPALWERISRDMAVRPAVRQAPAHSPLWSSLSFWRSSALAGAVASLVLAAGLGAVLLAPAPAPIVVAVLEADDSTPGAIVEAFSDGSILLRPLKPIDVPEGKTLQVWTLWDRAVGPVPLGLMDDLHRARLAADGQPVPRAEQLYEITLEPAGGSPTGRPTGPILYKGLAAPPL